ncbi:MAG: single-stranded-DNA-specific exonuclease RecJ [bacterium]
MSPTPGDAGKAPASPALRYVYQTDEELWKRGASLAKALGVRPTTAQVLLRRGVSDAQDARDYLEPRLKRLLDPAEMADFKRAVTRVADAVERKERCGVFGDYDVDGITAAAVITQILTELGPEPECRVASRDHGYGLTTVDIEAFRKAGCSLVIACDVGSGDHPAIDAAVAAGIDVVVLDHHHIPEDPPPAYALVNPGRPGCPFPFHDMASVGVAFYVAAALRTELDDRGYFADHEPPDVHALLDLVAVGTIADVVPLSGVNRIMVRAGLDRINELQRPGLRFLARLAGLQAGPPPITVKDIAFRLAPRLNAAGRMGDAMPALRLLLDREINSAWRCALELDGRNRQRQRLQEDVYTAAVERVEKGGVGESIHVVAGDNWHPGVVGIVASKLADLYACPTVVISMTDGEGRGSVRTFGGINIYDCLEASREHLVTFGGHASAAGLTVRRGDLANLTRALDHEVQAQIERRGGVRRTVSVDALVELQEVDEELVCELERIQPCGEGNPEPMLLTDPVVVVESRLVGNGHLRLKIAAPDGSAQHEVIGFGMGHRAPALGERLRVVFVAEHNTYRGKTSIQLRLLDLSPSEEGSGV